MTFNRCMAWSFALTMAFSPAYSCTNITVKANDGAVVVGRTLEFGPSLQSEIMTSPKGVVFSNTAPNGKPSLTWTSKYGYVYLNFFKQNHAVDGMNEKGLSIGYLYLPGYTKYPAVTDDNVAKALPYFQLGDWILGNFQSIEELHAAIQGLVVFGQALSIPEQGNLVFPLHMIVNDAQGKSLVIEFHHGEMQVYDNPMGIMTNSPTFDWQLTNLKNYVNLSPYAIEPITIDGYDYSATGQGAGMVGLPGDSTPPSRFVKMSFLQNTALPVETAEKAVVLAQHIIGNVFIPNGMVRNAKGSSGTETTQWTVFKDLTHGKLYFSSYDYPRLQVIDLKKLHLDAGSQPVKIAVDHEQPLAEDVTAMMK